LMFLLRKRMNSPIKAGWQNHKREDGPAAEEQPAETAAAAAEDMGQKADAPSGKLVAYESDSS
jgi:hypothetical protein